MDTKIDPKPAAPEVPETPDPNGGFCSPLMTRRHNRLPTWRWDYVNTLIRCSKQPSDDDDAWVHRAFEFRRQQLGLAGDAKPAPGLRAAYELFTSTEAFQRWVVEARFIAEQSVREVASATGISMVTLRAYEKLFYDVAGPNGDYPAVRTNVILPLQVRDIGPEDVERALKVFAFKGGPYVLEWVIEFYTTPPPTVPADPEAIDIDLLEQWHRRLLVQGAIDVEVFPPSKIAETFPLQRLVERIGSRLVELRRLRNETSSSGAA